MPIAIAQADDLTRRIAATENALAEQRLQAAEERQAQDAHLRTTEERWSREVDRARQEAASMQKQSDRLERDRAEAAKATQQCIEALETALRSSERAQAAGSAQVTALNAEIARLHEQWRLPRNAPKITRTPQTSSKPKSPFTPKKKR